MSSLQKVIDSIQEVDTHLKQQAFRAVNIALTLRNWIIGYYITEFEQQGKKRSEYGSNLLQIISERLNKAKVQRSEVRELRRYRQFYLTYPQIRESLTPELQKVLKTVDFPKIPKRESATPDFNISAKKLIENLSFTHFSELIKCEGFSKRSFYEVECIKGNWSVKELKRQMGSLYYERSGLSHDKEKLSNLAQENAQQQVPKLSVKDPYLFEFLGLEPKEVMRESQLEEQLTNKLQDFLLELGHGFCFEAKQKRILIGGEHYFIDLVFYHRILKCHVLVELKVEPFNHENVGQLNTYVNWYKKNVQMKTDNPPIGILLCTDKNHALAEYALAGMDNQLFASKYMIELPKKEEMQKFIDTQIENLD